MGFEHFGFLGLAAHVGAKNIFAKRLIGVVVHPELDRHKSRLQRQHVARETAAYGILDHLLLRDVVRGEKLLFIRVKT